MKLGKIKDDIDVLKLIVETILGKKFSKNTDVSWLQT
jgi:hypothetical protein